MSVKNAKLSNSKQLLEAAEKAAKAVVDKDGFEKVIDLYTRAADACDEGLAGAGDDNLDEGLTTNKYLAKIKSVELVLSNFEKGYFDPLTELKKVVVDIEVIVKVGEYAKSPNAGDFEKDFKSHLNIALQNIFKLHMDSDPTNETNLKASEAFLVTESKKEFLDKAFIVNAFSQLIEQRSLATKHDTAVAAEAYLEAHAEDLSKFDDQNVKFIETLAAIEKLSQGESIDSILALLKDETERDTFTQEIGQMALKFRDDFKDAKDTGKDAEALKPFAEHYLGFFLEYQKLDAGEELAKQVLNALHEEYSNGEVKLDVTLTGSGEYYEVDDFRDLVS